MKYERYKDVLSTLNSKIFTMNHPQLMPHKPPNVQDILNEVTFPQYLFSMTNPKNFMTLNQTNISQAPLNE